MGLKPAVMLWGGPMIDVLPFSSTGRGGKEAFAATLAHIDILVVTQWVGIEAIVAVFLFGRALSSAT